MTRLKIRTFVTSLILVSSVLGMATIFAQDLVTSSGQTFSEKDEINKLSEGFSNQTKDVTSERNQVNVAQENDYLLITEVWNVINSVVEGLSNIPVLISSAGALTGLQIPSPVYGLVSIVFAGVIMAVVAAARGWDV